MARGRRPAPIVSNGLGAAPGNTGGTDSGLGDGNGSHGPTILTIDPATLGNDGSANDGGPVNGGTAGNADGNRPRRKYTRRTGSTKASDTLSVSGLSSMLFSIHMGLTAVTKVPELMLSKDESDNLAQASADVLRHYPSMGVSAQAVDWMNLFVALGVVYGTRVVAYRARVGTKPKVSGGNGPQAPKPSTMADAAPKAPDTEGGPEVEWINGQPVMILKSGGKPN